MAAPAAKPGPIDQADIKDWTARLNEVVAKPAEVLNSKSAEDARPWHNSFFACCTPVDTCLISCCVPCITFGKTHHRTRKNGKLEGYETVNTSCLLFWGSSCFGLHWIPLSMQRSAIRHKYNLKGSCLTDIAMSCCCGCCDIVQQEKESEFREKELLEAGQYANNDKMEYPTQ